jgi:hypothetical protein
MTPRRVFKLYGEWVATTPATPNCAWPSTHP